ncbi:MAG: haloacid dehalogenase-like hydrolase [Oligoflexia bacterium]|nr:haloacid dehalogenase-like hydrolase [Oligoflexia bacterium]
MRVANLCWAPSVKRGLQAILNAGAGSGEAVVFDFDNTIILRNMGDPVAELLCRRGLCQALAIPRGLAREALSIKCGRPLAPEADLNAVYEQHLAQASTSQDCDDRIADAYAWAVWCLAGISPARVLEVVNEVYDGGSALQDCHTKGQPSRVSDTIYLRPFVHPDMLDLLADICELGYAVNIVSSSMPWTVRWVVQHVLNPGLRARGVKKEISPTAVFGIAPELIDGSRRVDDRTLVLDDPQYAAQSIQRLEQLRFGEVLSYPIACFAGKAEIVKRYISQQPYLVVGDSRNDAAMLEMARYKLWLKIVEKQETRVPELIAVSGAERSAWFIQAVNSVLNPGFRQEEVMLKIDKTDTALSAA